MQVYASHLYSHLRHKTCRAGPVAKKTMHGALLPHPFTQADLTSPRSVKGGESVRRRRQHVSLT